MSDQNLRLLEHHQKASYFFSKESSLKRNFEQNRSRIKQELNLYGYSIIDDFLSDQDVQNLIHTYYHNRPPELLGICNGYSITPFSCDEEYRKRVALAIQKCYEKKISNFLKDYKVVHGLFIGKQPDAGGGALGIHQDYPLVDERYFSAFNVWCPLVDVNEENGCLRVVPGSHTLNSKMRIDIFPYEKYLPIIEQYLVSIPMKLGQAVVFDMRIFHCSGANQTQEERVASNGLIIPDSSEMYYYHFDPLNHSLEKFRMKNGDCTKIQKGIRPDALESMGFIGCDFEQLTEDQIIETLEGTRAIVC